MNKVVEQIATAQQRENNQWDSSWCR